MPPAPPVPQPIGDRRAPWWAAPILVLVVVLAYANSLRGPFVFDDASSISQNPTIRSFSPPWAPLFPPSNKGLTVSGRPILNLSFALDHAMMGDGVLGYHLGNVSLHLAATLLLFGLIRRLLRAPALADRFGREATWIALVAAALWAGHPLMTEAVTYIVQRAESLMALLYLLTLYAVLRAATEGKTQPWYALAWAACWLGMGTKEVMVSAPVIALLMDRTFVTGSFAKAWKERKGLYLGLAASWAYLAVLVAGNGTNRGGSIGFGIGIGFWEHLLTQAPALARYARLLVWPEGLSINYDPVWVSLGQAIVPLVGVLVVIAACVVGFFRRPAAAFAGLLALAILAPTSLMPAPAQFTCEHRMYLPAAALIALAVAWTTQRWGRRLLWAWACLVPLAMVATVDRNADYRTDTGLWRDNVAKQPNDAISHEMLSEALDKQGNRQAAIDERLKTVNLYHGEPAGLAISECLLAQDLSLEGRRQEALPHFARAIEVRPDYAEAMVFYGVALESTGQGSQALDMFARAVQIDPKNPEAYYDQADALAELGRNEEAVASLKKALALRPDYYEAHFNLGNAYAALGRHPEAIAEFEAALSLRPESSRASYNLAGSWIALGALDKAIVALQASVKADPRYYDARCNLAIALDQTGHAQAALEQYEAAWALKPGSPELAAPIERLRRSLGRR